MAVIVKHTMSEERFILLGAGFGAYKATRPGAFLGNWSPVTDSGEMPVVLVCDSSGVSSWIKSDLLEVVSIDGSSPKDVLREGGHPDNASTEPAKHN